jgi:hypothetical protein
VQTDYRSLLTSSASPPRNPPSEERTRKPHETSVKPHPRGRGRSEAHVAPAQPPPSGTRVKGPAPPRPRRGTIGPGRPGRSSGTPNETVPRCGCSPSTPALPGPDPPGGSVAPTAWGRPSAGQQPGPYGDYPDYQQPDQRTPGVRLQAHHQRAQGCSGGRGRILAQAPAGTVRRLRGSRRSATGRGGR